MHPETQKLWTKIQNLLPADFGPVSSEALNVVEELLVKYPESSSVKVLLADMLLFSDDSSGVNMERAEGLLHEVSAKDPFCASAYSAFASLYCLQSKDELTLESSEFAMRLSYNVESVLSFYEFVSDAKQNSIPTENVENSILEIAQEMMRRITTIEAKMQLCITKSIVF